ncbi:polysaccharide pyruvyl transferase family protein [Micrococcus luteus]
MHLGFYNGRNFGDILSRRITEFVLGERVVEGHYAGADLTAIGSILGVLEKWRNPHRPYVWGSGFIEGGGRWQGREVQPVAVRGALTRERMVHMAEGPLVMGDPGLLVKRVYPALMNTEKRYDVTVIPHMRDKWSDQVRDLRRRPPHVNIVDAQAGPELVLEQIAASRLVLSSSLHGLVCADALGVPNQWTPITEAVEGSGYKFRDYYSAFGAEAVPVGLERALTMTDELTADWRPFEQVDAICDDLIRVFPRDQLLSRYRRT